MSGTSRHQACKDSSYSSSSSSQHHFIVSGDTQRYAARPRLSRLKPRSGADRNGNASSLAVPSIL